jgi:hypothetical protein
MSTELALALIASATSLLVALTGLVTSIITKRQTERSVEKMENLRFGFGRKEAVWALGNAQLTESLESLQSAIRAIQRVKDEVQLILAAIETSLDTETAIERVSSARADLFACYEKELAKFDNSESKACHQAKNRTLGIENFLRERLSQKSYASQLSGDERRRLLEFRDDLTDCQQRLRDSRADRLIGRMRDGKGSMGGSETRY